MTRRIREDAFTKVEAEAALRLGITIDQWDDLDDYQRAHALGPALADAERAAAACQQCGGPAAECQDPDNQHAYVVTTKRCYRTAAHMAAQKKREDTDGVMFVVKLDPALKKSARKKG